MRVLLTGASGFVGQAFLRRARQQSAVSVVAASRRPASAGDGIDAVRSPDLGPNADWRPLLTGVDVVVHAAARVHVMHDTATDPLAAFRYSNCDGTLALARQSAEAGVRRFVFLSSIKVNGEATVPGKPFRASDVPAPENPYGVSKLEAEQGLQALARETGMQVVIIRPVLVYGPGVKANFLSMMRWLRRGIPLPLGAINNRRSLVSVANLVDLIWCCLDHEGAANRTFMVSDGEDVSTSDLLRRLGLALGRPARLLPVHAIMLQWGASMLGRGDIGKRLCGSLQVDIADTRDTLGWHPPLSLSQGLQQAADAFLADGGGDG